MRRRNVLVPALILLNLVVFFMWSYFPEAFMRDHFTVSWLGLSQGRFWTLLTSEFSHVWLLHLVFNMFVLSSFGGLLERVLTRRIFLSLYLSAAVIASLAHAVVSNFLMDDPAMAAVGASGAIAGLLIVFGLMFPRERVLLFFVIPLPALWGALAFVGLDLWGLFAQSRGGGLPIGHGAHLGGALTGAVFYFGYLRRRWKARYPEAY